LWLRGGDFGYQFAFLVEKLFAAGGCFDLIPRDETPKVVPLLDLSNAEFVKIDDSGDGVQNRDTARIKQYVESGRDFCLGLNHYYEGLDYVCRSKGILYAVQLKTGQVVFKKNKNWQESAGAKAGKLFGRKKVNMVWATDRLTWAGFEDAFKRKEVNESWFALVLPEEVRLLEREEVMAKMDSLWEEIGRGKS
jgi:hypothetical protein